MFRVPGVLAIYLTSIVGRLPQGAVSVLLLLRAREVTGSYAAGGLVAAANGLAVAFGSPLLGRAIDRRGQRAVLVPAAGVSAAALGAFAALPDGAPLAAAVALALAAGAAQPPLNSCLRALLANVIAPEQRHRAFAIDSTTFELVYIAGPLLIVGGLAAWSLRAAIATCAVLVLAGTVAFAAARLSRAAVPAAADPHDLAGPLRRPGVRVLLAAVAVYGLSIGCLEVGLAAFAAGEGKRSAVGVLLAASGLGSMLGGLLAARAPAPAAPARRLVAMLALEAGLIAPAGLVHGLPAMAAVIVVGSLPISPAFALMFQLTADVAPAGTVTEAMTWLSSLLNGGVAAGAAVAGVLAEHVSVELVLYGIAFYCAAAAIVVRSRITALT